mmetsp:Transcript_5940/g.13833  ORF Transcript_5940/g.13833 Transcript_5940/m.13833 type:complete len:273 (+) Transcript_5940:927-1745(+)
MGRRSGRSRRRGVVAAHRFSSSTTDGSYRDFQRRHERLVDVVRIGGILGRIVVGIGTDRSPWNRRDITVVFVAIEASVLRGDRGLLQLLLLMLLLMVLLMLLPGHCVVVDHHWTGTIRSHSIRKLVRLAWINCYVLPWRYGTYHGAHHSSLLLLLLLLELCFSCFHECHPLIRITPAVHSRQVPEEDHDRRIVFRSGDVIPEFHGDSFGVGQDGLPEEFSDRGIVAGVEFAGVLQRVWGVAAAIVAVRLRGGGGKEPVLLVLVLLVLSHRFR